MSSPKLPARFVGIKARHPNLHSEGECERCGRPLAERVPLELDQRVNEFHDFGNVPPEWSQGWFDFGPDCAEAMRKRARIALSSVEGLQ